MTPSPASHHTTWRPSSGLSNSRSSITVTSSSSAATLPAMKAMKRATEMRVWAGNWERYLQVGAWDAASLRETERAQMWFQGSFIDMVGNGPWTSYSSRGLALSPSFSPPPHVSAAAPGS